MTNCELHCEGEWLPLDREVDHDAIVLDEGDGPYEYLPLLVPTQFVSCYLCNELAMINSDLKEISV